ncbi:hypothetical protein DFP72DRAFT_1072625 [Ephemerocybe angulata]|uniref:Uncharacterized protein n=1 Tax=Ephemerocybe angulata TaxID=980116 RepID=A0A8H6HNZ0_9AGAR|nr:hypothetical protein DFP72DRAFT_1072625 [Tulosesus angulatus]
MYTQADILAQSNAVHNAQQAGLCETVQCCVLGAEALPNSLIVSVPVHPGYEAQSRNIDLDIDQYLEHTGPSVGVRSLNRIGVCLERYPYGAPRHQKYSWSIFYINQTNSLRPRNRMYDSLKVETSGTWPLRSVYGNILVAKSTYDGRVCDVEEKDRSLIEMLVYSFIEDEASYHQFPVIKHPLRPDHADIPEFFDILDMCDGAVIGSVVQQILLSGLSANILPFDLNVVLAHDREDPLNSFLYRLGYQSSVEEPVKELCGDSVDRVEIQRITALVSKEEAISVLLRSPFTGQMNALTSTTLGSYYPRFDIDDTRFILPTPYLPK